MTKDSDRAAGRPAKPDEQEVSVARHPRSYRGSAYVYPVLSRRARGEKPPAIATALSTLMLGT